MKSRSAIPVVAALLLSAVCMAQDEGRREHRHGPDGGRGPEQAGQAAPGLPQYQQSSQDLQSRLQRFDGLLRQFDVNGDGTIQPSEVPRDRRYILEGIARRVQLDPNGPIPLARLREATMRYYAQGGSSGSSRPFGGSGAGNPPTAASAATAEKGPTVLTLGSGAKTLGFGGDTKAAAATVPGFGTSPATTAKTGSAAGPGASGSGTPGSPPATSGAPSPSPAASPSTPSPSSQPDNAMEQRYRRFAESMLRQYDTNKNGVLDRDEWSSTRPDLKAADRNGDGAITCDEMTAWLVEYSQRGSSWQRPSSASSGAAGGSGASPAGGSGPRKFYRALTATERLPEGLPEWFARKDANADGQISMAEFSGSWSEQAAAEFSNYDLNNDGIITPAECLGATNR